jgi:hypothetical protein
LRCVVMMGSGVLAGVRWLPRWLEGGGGEEEDEEEGRRRRRRFTCMEAAYASGSGNTPPKPKTLNPKP